MLSDKKIEKIQKIYEKYCKKALNPDDIRNWCVKKTVTKSILSPERSNEQKPLDACHEAINKGVIDGIQEGDKIYLYQTIDGQKQQIKKGELVFLKDGTPKMIDNQILRFPELYNDDHDKWHYVERVYKTLCILENVIDISKFTKFHLKSKRKLLTNEVT